MAALRDLTRTAVERALGEFDVLGREAFLGRYGFGQAKRYFVQIGDRLYDSKAIVGAAFGFQAPDFAPLAASDFSGGEATVAAVLQRLGFDVVDWEARMGAEGPRVDEADLTAERSLRLEVWRQLAAEDSGAVLPARLRDLGVYGGAQGIWVDKARTGPLTPDGAGIAVAVLHTGRSYADDLSEDALLYHYPRTMRPAARDTGEVAALKWAGSYELPVFAILPSIAGQGLRSVRLGWVEDYDDEGQVVLLSFGENPRGAVGLQPEDAPFFLTATVEEKRALRRVRQGQAEFHLNVIHRYGGGCAVCELEVPELIDAAHICPVSETGSSDERNGLPLCVLHHRAFDRGLWGVDPTTTELVPRMQGPTLKELGISRSSLAHLRARPHPAALAHAWKGFGGRQGR